MANKICKTCNINLNENNKVKNRLLCKSCYQVEYKEYVNTKLTENYNSDLIRTCNRCSIILTKENQTKNRPRCKSCTNAKKKEYKLKNKEKISADNKIYYQENKERISEYYKNHYIQNKDMYMENNRKWRKNNKEAINKKANERFSKDPIAKLKKCAEQEFIMF